MANLAENRKARFDYEILETIEAGIELTGHEAKSAQEGLMDLSGSHAVIRGGELWLLNASIAPFQPKNAPPDYDANRTRRLLAHKEELRKLVGTLNEKGVSLVPLRAYRSRGKIKVELGVARSKKKADKRQALKKRAAERDAGRRL